MFAKLKPTVIFAAALSLTLAGCLTSEGLLLDSKNARALAFVDGAYEACQIENAGEPAECQGVAVSHDASGLYTFQIAEEGEGPTFARFKRIGRGAWAAQMWGEGDDNPYYFLAMRAGDATALAMIECETLPDAYKKKYVARGQLEVREETTCVAKSAGAVVAAAKAWRATDAAKTGSRIVYRKKAS